MSPKSRYNRRNVSQNKVESASPASESVPAAQTVNTRNMRSASTAAANEKTVMEMTSSKTFLSDLKWISFVTLIIVILLIAAYFLFH
jgi:hypothetical protein